MIPDETDLALEARDAVMASGVDVQPIGEELEPWRIGDLIFSDSRLLRLAVSRGLIGEAR